MKRRLAHASFLSVVLIGLGLGCDDKPDPIDRSALPPPTADVPPEPAGPTTQQLLDGPRKTLALTPLPFDAVVPESWTVVTYGGPMSGGKPTDAGVNMLEGLAPSGPITIRLSRPIVLSADNLKRLFEQFDRDRAKLPAGSTLERRDVGGMSIVEQRDVPPASETAQWRVTYYVPESINYTAYEISFLGLTSAQLHADEAFLKQIVADIKPQASLKLR